MWLNANNKELQWFLESSTVYWEKNLPRPADDAVILVEAFHQDIRVNLRNLAFANAIRKLRPARMIVFTGVEDAWRRTLWSGFDVGIVRQVAEAFGAAETIDVWELVRQSPARPIDAVVTEYTDATYCRLAKVPRLPADYQSRADYRQRLGHCRATQGGGSGFYLDLNRADAGFKRHRCQGLAPTLHSLGDYHVSRADKRMPREWKLVGGCEDPHVIIAVLLRRKEKRCLRIVHLARDVLHRSAVEARAVEEDRQLVSPEALLGKDISDHEPPAVVHASLRFRTLAIRRIPWSIISGF